jgi:hypothetical protein
MAEHAVKTNFHVVVVAREGVVGNLEEGADGRNMQMGGICRWEEYRRNHVKCRMFLL